MICIILAVRISLRDGMYIDNESSVKISKHEHAWYYVQLSKRADISEMRSLYSGTLFPISSKMYSAFLSRMEADHMSQKFWVKKIPSAHKLGSTAQTSDYFAVFCSGQCKLPGKLITGSDILSIIQYSGNISYLSKIKCIRAFENINPNPKFHIRYNFATTHSNESLRYNPRAPPAAFSKLESAGFHGNGECIAIVDKGIDPQSPWLQKPPGMDPKILTFYDIADNTDDYDGHGTFLAGIAAGMTHCSVYASSFNGIATMARILPIDIHNREKSQMIFPSNLSDLYEPPSKLGCKISLNAWSFNSSFLSKAIDLIAYNNPDLLMIFPSEKGSPHPSDANNVLTIGSTFGMPASRSFFEKKTEVIVATSTGITAAGFTDEAGSPLLFGSKTLESDLFNIPISRIGCSHCVGIVENSTLSEGSFSILLVFHQNPLKGNVSIPVIRLPKKYENEFADGTSLSFYPSFYQSDSLYPTNYLSEKCNYLNPFQIKPDLVISGGPLIGPKAFSPLCNANGLTVKEGPSVAAAVAAGDAALVREFLQKQHLIVGKPSASLVKAFMIHSATDRSESVEDEFSSDMGWGTPTLENVFLAKPQSSIAIFQNINISSESRVDYCVTAQMAGVIRATLVWADYPHDPLAHPSLTTPLYMTAATERQPSIHILSGNKKTDYPHIDIFNTVKQIDVEVQSEMKVRISVFSTAFELFDRVNYSLVISGPFKGGNAGLGCEKCFESSLCPRPCEGGRTSQCFKPHNCICAPERGGDFCSFKSEKAIIGQRMSINALKRMEWKYIKVSPEHWERGDALTIDLKSMNNSEITIKMSVGRLPWIGDAQCSSTNCYWAKTNNGEMSFPYEDWDFASKSNPFYFGFFCTVDNSIPFDILFNVTKSNSVE